MVGIPGLVGVKARSAGSGRAQSTRLTSRRRLRNNFLHVVASWSWMKSRAAWQCSLTYVSLSQPATVKAILGQLEEAAAERLILGL